MEPKSEGRPPKADDAWTYGRLLDWTAKFLAQKGCESPRLDTEVLLGHALGCKRIELYTRYEEPATENERGPLQGADPQAAGRLPGGLSRRPQGVLFAGVRGRSRRPHPTRRIPKRWSSSAWTSRSRCPTQTSSTSAPGRVTSRWRWPGSTRARRSRRSTSARRPSTWPGATPPSTDVAERIRFLAGDLFAADAVRGALRLHPEQPAVHRAGGYPESAGRGARLRAAPGTGRRRRRLRGVRPADPRGAATTSSRAAT